MSMRIVTEPTVSLVGSSRLHAAGFMEFINSEQLNHLLEDPTTPIAKIMERVMGDESQYTQEETLPEIGGRMCYGSWSKGRETDDYMANILEERHGSVLRHTYLNFTITGVSRSLSHELVRHAIGFEKSQWSMRYVDQGEARFVVPPLLMHFLDGDVAAAELGDWYNDNLSAMETYEKWQDWYKLEIADEVDSGKHDGAGALNTEESIKKQRRKALTHLKKRANEAARAHAPHDIETKLLWTVNLASARHFIMSRGADSADLEIRRLAVSIANKCIDVAPTVFCDIEIVPGSFGVPCVIGEHWKV